MSGSNVWSRSREKLKLFPEIFAQCADEVSTDKSKIRGLVAVGLSDGPQRCVAYLFATNRDVAAIYGKCVADTTTGKQELKKDLCAREFEALKMCFRNAARKRVR